jgi:hypothetical protein
MADREKPWNGRCDECGDLMGVFLNVAIPVDGQSWRAGLFCSRACAEAKRGQRGQRKRSYRKAGS